MRVANFGFVACSRTHSRRVVEASEDEAAGNQQAGLAG